MYPNVSALCNKCRNQAGTLTHQLWTCPSLHSFWSSIFDFYSKAFNRLCELCPLVAILGSAGDSTKSVQQSLCFGAILAKRHWKSDNVPSIERWMRGLSEILCMEKLWYKNAGRREPVLKYLKDLREVNVTIWTISQDNSVMILTVIRSFFLSYAIHPIWCRMQGFCLVFAAVGVL